ncbi:MAG TPA: hypothetical protein VFI31_27450 [Pirellulales bacterium]|nr:hypothetical protein [Pirellulales bacterium]
MATFITLKLGRDSGYPGTLFLNLDDVQTVHVSEDGSSIRVGLRGSDKQWTLTGENVMKVLHAIEQHLPSAER